MRYERKDKLPPDWERLVVKGLESFDLIAEEVEQENPDMDKIRAMARAARGAYEALATHANGPLP